MTAIRAAFERHEIHCATPAVDEHRLRRRPDQAPPVVTATPQRSLPSTSRGPRSRTRPSTSCTAARASTGCDIGKVKIVGEIEPALAFRDTGLQNGRTYSYSVAAGRLERLLLRHHGRPVVDACRSPGRTSSMHDQVRADRRRRTTRSSTTARSTTISFDLDNCGDRSTLTNVRIISIRRSRIRPRSSPGRCPMPLAADLATARSPTANIQIQPQGLVTSTRTTRLPGRPRRRTSSRRDPRTTTLSLPPRRERPRARPASHGPSASKTDDEGWQVDRGTFVRSTGAAPTERTRTSPRRSTSTTVRRRSELAVVRPVEHVDPLDLRPVRHRAGFRRRVLGSRQRLRASTSTPATGRSSIPTAGPCTAVANGRANGTCATGGQAGWNARLAGQPELRARPPGASAALNPGGAFTGRLAQLDVRYGTDANLAGAGFDFDEVTITNFYVQVPDAQSDTCLTESVAPKALAVDAAGNGVLEAGETATISPTWRNIGIARDRPDGRRLELHGPGGRDVRPHGHGGRVRHHRDSRGERVLGLLRGDDHGGDPAGDALGRDRRRDGRQLPDRACTGDEGRGRSTSAGASPTFRLVQPLLSGDRDRAAQRRDGRLRRRRHLLPGRQRDPAADGGLPAQGQGGRRIHASRLHDRRSSTTCPARARSLRGSTSSPLAG